MCGICGFVTKRKIDINELKRMNDTLAHRGPDDQGEEIYLTNSDYIVGFAHKRLSIIDLSQNGHQPMHSKDRSISVVFNGEIYNFMELKSILSDYSFSSNSDTEVIIAAYQKWGIDFVNRLNGMFAIAIFDRMTDTVYLIRDYTGKKPLYYHITADNDVVFGSELKALLECSVFTKDINTDIIGRFLYRMHITLPDTIYKNTYKLEPGSILKIEKSKITKQKYWDVSTRYNQFKDYIITDYDKARMYFKQLMVESVRKRMVADVPVGAFLSGGFDSSLVCSIAQEISAEPIKTYSIGFYEDNYNEADYAKEISKILGTNHTELYISENEMINIIDSIPCYYDEPFADPSEIPTMIVSELAKKDVSVVLTGDGGDELFGGYSIYSFLQEVQKYLEGSKVRWDSLDKKSIIYRILSESDNKKALTQVGVNGYLEAIDSILNNPVNNYLYEIEDKYQEDRLDTRRMLLDLEYGLSEQMLTKVDRATMRYALEARCPFLDKNVIEFSFRIHPDFKVKDGICKRIIKDAVYDYLPEELMNRPKMGFGVPQDKWLRGILKDRILEWSREEYLSRQGIFKPSETRELIETYMRDGDQGKWSGKNHSRIVWSYFIFQQWYEKYY